MSFELSKFGDGSAAGAGNVVSQVHNHFGPRSKGGETVGVYDTDGTIRELAIDINGEMLGLAAFQLMVPTLPKGATVLNVLAEITEAFVLGGTTPAIKIGTKTTEATNGVSISEAQAEAVGNYVLATAGTWSSPLAAATTVGIAFAGTSPTTTKAGRGRVVIRYMVI